jgi:uncharacterized protein YceK
MRTFFLCIALAMTAGCASVPPATQGPPPHANTLASKADVARYAEQLLADNYAKDGPGAAVIVVRGDEVLFRGARGMGDVEHAVPLSADAMFKIGSITKQFAAAGLFKLVESARFHSTTRCRNSSRTIPTATRSRCWNFSTIPRASRATPTSAPWTNPLPRAQLPRS